MEALKIYRCTISEDLDSPMEVQAVALVDEPAIAKNFLAFKTQNPQVRNMLFAVDVEKQIISGPAMLAGTPIYRKDAELGEYLVTFDKPTIFAIVQKFFYKGFNQHFNIMHDPAQRTKGVCIFESFITDASRGVQPMKGFEDAPDGSWFISARVNNADIWAKIKQGAIKGFSVEGVFKLIPVAPAAAKPHQQPVRTGMQERSGADGRVEDRKFTAEETFELIKEILNETIL